jgi:hypothetical protein
MRKSKSPQINLKPSIAFVVDGESEVWYLQMLKRNEKSINVNLEPRIPQKKKLKDQIQTVLALSKDFAKVFWIIDFDVLVQETKKTKKGQITPIQIYEAFRKKIKKHDNITLIINNPCLEFWLLLHFEETSKYFENCDSAHSRLKKYLPDYKKTSRYYTKQGDDIYLKLKPNLGYALRNAKRLGLFDPANPLSAKSEMHLFFNSVEFKKILNDIRLEFLKS